MNKLGNPSRIVIAIGAMAMSIIFFVPVWSIYLIAPQYPEGLSMQIWLNKITGQVDIINGLNHYIGMKHIKAEMFPEFKFLNYIAGFFILLGIIIAITGNRKLLFGYILLSVFGGIAALIDFYIWGYNYGHDLDPSAAIQVPGLSYQPPLIGHKKLLNFDSYSYPDTGAWVVVIVTCVFFIVWFIGWRKSKHGRISNSVTKPAKVSMAVLMILFLLGCKNEPEKIMIGKDTCSECRMTIVDAKFGAELLTKKGRVYKFDDVRCLATFLQRRGVPLSDISQTLFVDYNTPHGLVPIKSAGFVVSSQLKSPMGGNTAVFHSSEEAEKKAAEIEGSRTSNWPTLYNILIK